MQGNISDKTFENEFLKFLSISSKRLQKDCIAVEKIQRQKNQ